MIGKNPDLPRERKTAPGPTRDRRDATDPDQFLEQDGPGAYGMERCLAERLERALHHDELLRTRSRSDRCASAVRIRWRSTLVRLRGEGAAMLPPGAFLPVFEHCGMMPEPIAG